MLDERNAPSADRGQAPFKLRELLPFLVPALTAIGLALYGALAFGYSRFYGEFGVSPDEVGLGYVQALSRSAGAVFLFFAIGFAYVAIGVVQLRIVYRSLVRAADRADAVGRAEALRDEGAPQRGGASSNSDGSSRPRELLLYLASTLAAVALVVVVVVFATAAKNRADQVRQGQAVGPVKFLVGSVLLDLRAQPATILWTGRTSPATSVLKGGRCLMYLGQSDGTTVLYDPLAGETLRVPSAAVLVEARVSGSCPVSGPASVSSYESGGPHTPVGREIVARGHALVARPRGGLRFPAPPRQGRGA